jgi:uncharacterized integral membrane protein
LWRKRIQQIVSPDIFKRTMRRLKHSIQWIAVLLLMSMTAWFMTENSAPVQPQLWSLQLPQLSLGAWLVLAFFAGACAASLVTSVALARWRLRLSSVERQNAREKERAATPAVDASPSHR